MKKRTKWLVSIVFLFVGFMVTVQFQTTSYESQLRETRDVWEVREELKRQQDAQHELLGSIADADQTIEDYEEQSSGEQLDTLIESIEVLEERIGLKKQEGAGLEMTIAPIFEESFNGQAYPKLSAPLLHRLLNELNTYGANEISIGEERITNLSPIRDVNGSTYVNNRPIGSLPITMKVLATDPEKLRNYMKASPTQDIFNVDNMEIKIELKDSLTLPKFDEALHLEFLEETGG